MDGRPQRKMNTFWQRNRHRVINRVLLAMAAFTPRSPRFDRLFAALQFYKQHHRFPRESNFGHNDASFQLRVSPEFDDPLRVFLSDKELAKYYVAAKVSWKYAVPTIAVLRTPEEVDAFDFPPKCAIKATHAVLRTILRNGGEPVDRTKIKGWFKEDFYATGRERNYRGLVPKVIVEPLVYGSANEADFKVFCLDGKPKAILVVVDRYKAIKTAMYTTSWELLPFTMVSEVRFDDPVPRPDNLDEMLKVAEALSQDLRVIRVDLYTNGKTCFVGELTNCTGGGFNIINPPGAEKAMGNLIYGCS